MADARDEQVEKRSSEGETEGYGQTFNPAVYAAVGESNLVATLALAFQALSQMDDRITDAMEDISHLRSVLNGHCHHPSGEVLVPFLSLQQSAQNLGFRRRCIDKGWPARIRAATQKAKERDAGTLN
ncbi:MAG: hypothetical protein FJ288_11180 [Planctomycetes bacterium]|nr:hypothetical protein [Planctomycetota bacterium]